MEQKEIKKPSQEARILLSLEKANGQWVSGRFFLQTMLLSQYHARIHSLQKQGYRIEASEERDIYNFKSYRLLPSDRLF